MNFFHEMNECVYRVFERSLIEEFLIFEYSEAIFWDLFRGPFYMVLGHDHRVEMKEDVSHLYDNL